MAEPTFTHPYFIPVQPRASLYVALNRVLYDTPLVTGNTEPAPLSVLLPHLSVFLNSIASGTFTLEQVIQVSEEGRAYLLQFRGPGEFYRPAAAETEEELPPQNVSDAPVAHRCDRIALLQSADGDPLVSFSQLSLETALEVVTDPDEPPYAGLVENVLLLGVRLLMRPAPPRQCSCGSQVCTCAMLATPQLQLLQKALNLLLPDAQALYDDRRRALARSRERRRATVRFLERWLLYKYPEDCSLDAIDALARAYQRLCQIEGGVMEVSYSSAQQVEFRLSGPDGEPAQPPAGGWERRLERLINRVNQVVLGAQVEGKKQQLGQGGAMLRPHSSALSLLHFDPGQQVPQYLGQLDTATICAVLFRERMGNYYARLDYKLSQQVASRAQQQSVVQINQANLDILEGLLLQQPVEFVLLLSQYFAEAYLAVTPVDIAAYATKQPSLALEGVFRRFNSLNLLL